MTASLALPFSGTALTHILYRLSSIFSMRSTLDLALTLTLIFMMPLAALSSVCLFDGSEIYLLHFTKDFHHTVDLGGTAFAHDFGHERWCDLPGDSKFIFEPAALLELGLSRKFLPIIVYLFLRVAEDHERQRLIEFEVLVGTKCPEGLAGQLEQNHLTIPIRCVVDGRHAQDLRVWKHRDIKLRGLLDVCIEPKTGRDGML